MIRGIAKDVTRSISFDGTEDTAKEINYSVQMNRDDNRVLLDITHPTIQNLAQNKDHRLFELLQWLPPYALKEANESQDSE